MMRRFGLPVLPLILGVILGPLMETKLREALTISGGDLSGLFDEPLAVVVYVLIAPADRGAAGAAPVRARTHRIRDRRVTRRSWCDR